MTRLRVPAHRASSLTLAGAYPFLTPPPLTAGVPVGVDALTGEGFSFDPWQLYNDGVVTNPNVLLAGVIGSGKSALAKSLAVRSIAAGRSVYVPGDPKGEWAPVAAAVGGTVLRLEPGGTTRLNPLDPGALDEAPARRHARHAGLLGALAATLLRRRLHPGEHAALDDALHTAQARTAPTIGGVVAALTEPAGTQRDLGLALGRLTRGDLAGMFDGPTTTALDAAAPMLVLDLSALASDDDALACATACATAWLDTVLTTSRTPRWIVYDEAWRLMRVPALLATMQTQWKLSRAYGIANLLILHRLSDLAAVADTGTAARALADGLLADASVRIIYRQESDQLTAATTAFALTDPEQGVLPLLPRGTGLWKLPAASYLVQHRLHPDEARIYDTDTAMRHPAGGAR